jgi:hypothetical protein
MHQRKREKENLICSERISTYSETGAFLQLEISGQKIYESERTTIIVCQGMYLKIKL